MSWTITLPITKPLSLNDREHWAVKAQRTRKIREHVAATASVFGIPQLDHPRVVLHYQPRDKRRRDPLNLASTLKACEDGLVTAGVLVDDDGEHFTSTMPVIDQPNGVEGRLWIVIEERCRRCGGTGDPSDDEAERGRMTCRACAGSGWS